MMANFLYNAMMITSNLSAFYVFGVFMVVIFDKITGMNHMTSPFWIMLAVWCAGYSATVTVGFFFKGFLGL